MHIKQLRNKYSTANVLAPACITAQANLAAHTYLLVGKYWHLVRRTATHGVMVVRLSPHTHPATGEARLDVWEVGQLTLVILSGTVDICLQGALQF